MPSETLVFELCSAPVSKDVSAYDDVPIRMLRNVDRSHEPCMHYDRRWRRLSRETADIIHARFNSDIDEAAIKAHRLVDDLGRNAPCWAFELRAMERSTLGLNVSPVFRK